MKKQINDKFIINQFSEIIKNCKYVISELNLNKYFDGEGIFFGINKISDDFIDSSVVIKYGWPIANDIKIIRFHTSIILNNLELEKLIQNTLQNKFKKS